MAFRPTTSFSFQCAHCGLVDLERKRVTSDLLRPCPRCRFTEPYDAHFERAAEAADHLTSVSGRLADQVSTRA